MAGLRKCACVCVSGGGGAVLCCQTVKALLLPHISLFIHASVVYLSVFCSRGMVVNSQGAMFVSPPSGYVLLRLLTIESLLLELVSGNVQCATSKIFSFTFFFSSGDVPCPLPSLPAMEFCEFLYGFDLRKGMALG